MPTVEDFDTWAFNGSTSAAAAIATEATERLLAATIAERGSENAEIGMLSKLSVVGETLWQLLAAASSMCRGYCLS